MHSQGRHRSLPVLVVVLGLGGGTDHAAAQASWRGLVVAPEARCAPYDAAAYRYPPSVEARIVAALGGVYGPYTGRWFASPRDTDIEHIVARSEAHDSGLCAADAARQRRFASDLLNLTLASPAVNRTQKNDKDAAEWLPELNQCWFADRVVAVRQKFGLTIDPREAAALDRVLAGCSTPAMLMVPRSATSPQRPTPPPPASEALARWDDNGNGRITCAEARRHGIAPVRRDHPASPHMRDADNDGIVCEQSIPDGRRRAPFSPTSATITGERDRCRPLAPPVAVWAALCGGVAGVAAAAGSRAVGRLWAWR